MTDKKIDLAEIFYYNRLGLKIRKNVNNLSGGYKNGKR